MKKILIKVQNSQVRKNFLTYLKHFNLIIIEISLQINLNLYI
jgi:hypothetical protein